LLYRKEVKDHGEGGQLVGAPLQGKVVIIDDVITAGTAIRECMPLIEHSPATLAGVAISLDRLEKGRADTSATEEISTTYQIPVISIVNLNHLVDYLKDDADFTENLRQMKEYRLKYAVESYR